MDQETQPESSQQTSAAAPQRARRLVRAILFFAGSAAFGGLAVALWDRKTLAAIRRKDIEPNPARTQDDDIY